MATVEMCLSDSVLTKVCMEDLNLGTVFTAKQTLDGEVIHHYSLLDMYDSAIANEPSFKSERDGFVKYYFEKPNIPDEHYLLPDTDVRVLSCTATVNGEVIERYYSFLGLSDVLDFFDDIPEDILQKLNEQTDENSAPSINVDGFKYLLSIEGDKLSYYFKESE